MIQVDGQLCYSPRHPSTYRLGLANQSTSMYGYIKSLLVADIQLWNLVFMSCVDVEAGDNYRMFTACGAALTGTACLREFPTLRQSLMKPPMQFMDDLWEMPWMTLPMILTDPVWYDTVIDNAANLEIERKATATETVSKNILGVLGNVIKFNFGKQGGS